MFSSVALRTAACIILCACCASGQISQFPYEEHFDLSLQPPPGWELVGFTISSTTPRSTPSCLSATGNTQDRVARSPHLNLRDRIASELVFYERRTSTAIRYRLSVSFIDDSSSFKLAVAHFDSIPVAGSYVERKCTIPGAQLTGYRGLRLVFEVLRDSTNSSGVLRIDDITLSTELQRDVAIRSVTAMTGMTSRDTLMVAVLLRNGGRESSPPSDVTVNTCQESGVLAQTLAPSLTPKDSLLVVLRVPPLPPGEHCLTCRITVDGDENPANDSLSVLLQVGYPSAAIVVSEIMFSPVREDEPEWIELHNPGPDTVDLSGFTISDNSSSKALLTSQRTVLSPGRLLLVSRSPDLPFVYQPIDVSVLVSAIPSLNNTTPDAVVLRDGSGRTIDSVWYHPDWSDPGVSIERVDWMLPSIMPSTWKPSQDSSLATPGRQNSVQRMDLDLSMAGVHVQLFMDGSPSATIVARLRNSGRNGVHDARVVIFADTSGDGMLAAEEFIAQSSIGGLPSSDSIDIAIVWHNVPPGRFSCTAIAQVDGDERSSNDTAYFDVVASFPPGDILVNEIMFDPNPGKSEWIELFNRGVRSVDLSGWSVSDRPTTSGGQVRTFMHGSRTILHPGGYAIVAADSSLFEQYEWLADTAAGALTVIVNRTSGLGLNTDGDAVILKDLTERTIDSIAFSDDWHLRGIGETQGRSLERTRIDIDGNDQRAWSSAPGPLGCSPGKANVSRIDVDRSPSALNISPNPFSPDGDGFEDIAVIRFSVVSPTVVVRALVFDIFGRAVRTIADGLWTSGSDLITWDGRNDNGRSMPMGMYIVLLEASDPAGTAHIREKLAIALVR